MRTCGTLMRLFVIESVHFGIGCADAGAIKVELHIGMLGQKRHRHACIGDVFGDHQARQAHSEGIVVGAGVPDGNFFGLPCLLRPNCQRVRGHNRQIAAARCTRVLNQSQRVQFDNARAQFPILRR